MNKTKITWTDESWNPVTGCKHKCSYCYARRMSARFGRSWEPQIHPERLEQPLKNKKPKKIFVGSMADLFGNWVPDDWIMEVLNIVEQCPEKTFIFLTKNPERMVDIPWPSNAWIGASTVNQKGLKRARSLFDAVAPVRFISAEPLLEPVRLNKKDAFDWVIIGAQTGPKKFQPPQVWVDDLTEDARCINAAVFYKPNLDCFKINPIEEFPIIQPSAVSRQLTLDSVQA